MENFDFIAYKKMVKTYQENNDPTGWFDSIYKNAQGDFTKVFWADLEPSPYLVNWLKENPIKKENKTACVIGCGVGDDAQALNEFGFDISPSAIELCINRYPNTKVYLVLQELSSYNKVALNI